MLLSAASREDAVFPKSPYHQELGKKPVFLRKGELSEEPRCHIILHYIKSSNNG